MKLWRNSKLSRSLSLVALGGMAFATVGTIQPAWADDCCGKCPDKTAAACKQAEEAPVFYKSGIDPKDLDKSVKPSDDFFSYAVGGWQAANPIPADQARWGSFTILDDNTTKIIHDILERVSVNPKNALEKKLGDFYASGMDQETINREGFTPLRKELNTIAAAETPQQLAEIVAHLQTQTISPYFVFYSGQDDKNSERVIGHLSQGGLGLPERDYYTRDDEKSKLIRAKYRQHLINVFRLLGDTEESAVREAEAVIALETRLAKASLTMAEMRDPERVYHLMSVDELKKLSPNFPWDDYFAKLYNPGLKEVNVMTPEFFKVVDDELFKTGSLEDNRSYLRWNLVSAAAPYLFSELEEEHFDFYSKTLEGVTVMKPRWKRVSNVVGSRSMMGFALGEIYVEQYFSPEAKAKVQEIVANITKVMERDIPHLTWMSPATQKEALKKLHSFTAKIGYPEVNRDYSDLKISRCGYYDNVRNGRIFERARQMKQIGKPVDRTEWHMVPQMINAYYNPSCNEIVFPAGILQPPFFNKDVDDAANYGGIGMVIGHEMSHGFDDQGAQYDGQGNLRNWWQEEDLKTFQKLAKGVEDQFSEYTIGGTHLNGKLVLGESIADLSGLALSWRAYELSRQGKKDEIIDGLTPAQRFFLNYAKIWAINMRPEKEQLQIHTDPHPHAKWRVNGPLSNMDVFFKAFNVKPGDPMRRPDDKINKIW